MPAHVFADQLHHALRIGPTGRVHRAGLRRDGLPRVQCIQRARQRVDIDAQCRLQDRRHTQHCFDRLVAAHPATAAPVQIAPPLIQRGRALGRDLDLQRGAFQKGVHRHHPQVLRVVHDALAQRKPQREIFQVFGVAIITANGTPL